MTKERIAEIRETLKTRSEGGVACAAVGNGSVVRGGVEIIKELLTEVERKQDWIDPTKGYSPFSHKS